MLRYNRNKSLNYCLKKFYFPFLITFWCCISFKTKLLYKTDLQQLSMEIILYANKLQNKIQTWIKVLKNKLLEISWQKALNSCGKEKPAEFFFVFLKLVIQSVQCDLCRKRWIRKFSKYFKVKFHIFLLADIKMCEAEFKEHFILLVK